jgi:hypothetical protein
LKSLAELMPSDATSEKALELELVVSNDSSISRKVSLDLINA